ncbi:hypothetical protein P7C70_g1206, partial [Phenoliferia sp. Uapishka_3]
MSLEKYERLEKVGEGAFGYGVSRRPRSDPERAERGLTRDAFPTSSIRLLDIVHNDTKLYLVFEFLDMDLKRYMDKVGDGEGLGADIVQKFVRFELASHPFRLTPL